MSWHGKVWWLTFKGTDGKPRFENSGTPDAAEAQKLLAQRALPRARAAVAELERIANGEADQSDGEAGGIRRRPSAWAKSPSNFCKSSPKKEPKSDSARGQIMGLAMMQPKLRCAIYARVSPKPEGAAGDNFSVASQLHELREKVLREFGCADPDEYVDKKHSGGTLDRPDLDRLRDNIAAKLYDIVAVLSPDRWTREPGDKQILKREIEKGGARLILRDRPVR